MKKTIRPYPGGIINQNGNNMNVTLDGYGSVTPGSVLQEWINKMSQKNIDEWADRCDEWQKTNGHKKFEWKQPVFKKKTRNWNPFAKNWEVSEEDWSGGSFRDFKTLPEAIDYAKTCSNIFVDIKNKITNENFRVRDLH